MVVAGNAGGIPLQMPGELGNYLVDSIEQCAEKIVYLLQNPQKRERLGQKGHEVITHHFLTPRLVRDELSLIKELLGK
jgi:trehalose synthase